MPLVVYDRVQQTGTANTTVSFTLTGSVLGYQSFAVVGNGNTTYYAATDASGNWEVGLGTYSTTGPTLTRTTIISSSNSGSAVTFSGQVNVFVTYPAEDAVYLNGGNVSPLGTVSSGTWQGTTVAVAYGGTGVTTSSGANSVVLRDSNTNINGVNNLFYNPTKTTAAGGTTVLTIASTQYQRLVGSTNQTFQLPQATTLPVYTNFIFDNDGSGNLYVVDNASNPVYTVLSGGIAIVYLEDNTTSAGSWTLYAASPSSVQWGTNLLALGSTTITGGTWQGGTIGVPYGGTGLSSISASNYALYSSAPNTLTAGTLPVAAGGTGATTLTANNVILGNGTSAVQFVAPGTSGNVLTSNGTTWSSTAPSNYTDQAYFLSFMMG
jgi:hypothetical protein